MTQSPGLRVAAVIAAVFVLHEAVLRGLRIAGVRPDLLLGLLVVAGIVGGPERGAVCGFACGLLADVFLPTPLGLSALTGTVVGYAVGALQINLLPAAPTFIPLTVLAASLAGVLAFALLAALLGEPAMVTPHLAVIALIVGLVNSALGRPFAWALRWAFGRVAPTPAQSARPFAS